MVDNLTSAQRSRCMSRVRNRDTSLEVMVRSGLHRCGLRFRKHVRGLPGRPDVVFPRARVAVFVDGDFWHGYRLPLWQDKLTVFWRKKIGCNRRRDATNFRHLRQQGWTVIRLWGHEILGDLAQCVAKVAAAVNHGLQQSGQGKRRNRA
jgi:DNA mismatch endonuclease, patch repair protein